MYVWIDNNDEDIRVSVSEEKLKKSIEKDYEMEYLEWEIRDESIALVENGEDVYDEMGVIMKAKVVK